MLKRKPVGLLIVGVFGLLSAAMAQQAPPPSGPNPQQTQSASPTVQSAGREYFNVKDGRLNLKLQNRPLEWILETLSDGSGVAIITAEGVGAERVTLELKDVPLEEGLRKILKDHDSFFFYAGDQDSPASLKAVWVYAKGRARGVKPVPVEQWASTKELEGRLNDPDPEVRSKALVALVERRGAGARDAVLKALKEDKDTKVRMRALQAALSRNLDLPDESVMGMLYDASETIRFLALDYLSEHPNAQALAQQALVDPSEHVRNKAREILERLDQAARPPAAVPPAVQGQQQQRPPRAP